MSKPPMIDVNLGFMSDDEAQKLDSLVEVARNRGAAHAGVTKELNGSWRFRAQYTDETVGEAAVFCRMLSDACGGVDVTSIDEDGREIGILPGSGRN